MLHKYSLSQHYITIREKVMKRLFKLIKVFMHKFYFGILVSSRDLTRLNFYRYTEIFLPFDLFVKSEEGESNKTCHFRDGISFCWNLKYQE
jgi:hypothetical protein